MSNRRALITGVTGQDGTYLAEFLATKDYEIYGLARRSSADICQPIERLRLNNKIQLIHGDIRDHNAIERALSISKPDEIYNLASQSHVGVSFECPEETKLVNYNAALFLINSALKLNPTVKIYQASSSEMFGGAMESPQTEKTPLNPKSPYGESKVLAYLECQKIRKVEGAFICSGITYNHESPRRSKNFVTRKITNSIAKIKVGQQSFFSVGNIYTKRDWGYAVDYIEAMWRMMQQNTPNDFIIATGITHTVKDFIDTSAKSMDIKMEWVGSDINEKAIDTETGLVIVSIDKKFYRPTEPVNLVGDSSLAYITLGWKPTVNFKELVKIMSVHDLNSLTKHA